MKDNSEWTLEEFMERKAREAGGGRFYQVTNRGLKLGTYWARSVNDLITHLSRMDVKWDTINRLI